MYLFVYRCFTTIQTRRRRNPLASRPSRLPRLGRLLQEGGVPPAGGGDIHGGLQRGQPVPLSHHGREPVPASAVSVALRADGAVLRETTEGVRWDQTRRAGAETQGKERPMK